VRNENFEIRSESRGIGKVEQPEHVDAVPWDVLDEVLNADSVANDYRMKPRVLKELRRRGYGPTNRVEPEGNDAALAALRQALGALVAKWNDVAAKALAHEGISGQGAGFGFAHERCAYALESLLTSSTVSPHNPEVSIDKARAILNAEGGIK
jgi:hypothetical protein